MLISFFKQNTLRDEIFLQFNPREHLVADEAEFIPREHLVAEAGSVGNDHSIVLPKPTLLIVDSNFASACNINASDEVSVLERHLLRDRSEFNVRHICEGVGNAGPVIPVITDRFLMHVPWIYIEGPSIGEKKTSHFLFLLSQKKK